MASCASASGFREAARSRFPELLRAPLRERDLKKRLANLDEREAQLVDAHVYKKKIGDDTFASNGSARTGCSR